MRRFSQRSALVTLSEINITPLLDLAFVLWRGAGLEH
jgi:biopolymer transport protein ExbD